MIRVLVVEDSKVLQDFMVHVLTSDPGIRVIGVAKNGEEAITAVETKRPDVITMDFHMPKLNGLEATRRIMETCPTPIVIVSSSLRTKEVTWTFQAMEAGALAVAERPRALDHADHDRTALALIQTVKLMSEVKVVRRWTRSRIDRNGRAVACPAPPISPSLPDHVHARTRIVAIGASTGGPPVLQRLLSALPATLPVPILIVQHISPGFLDGLVEWLQQTCAVPVRIACDGERAIPGQVYFAADGRQMRIEPDGRLSLRADEPEDGHRPSASSLFRSVARSFGSSGLGILLTGMGRDGATGLKAMRDRGAVTVVQDKESAVVHGMPGEAIELNAAMYVLEPERMATMLASLNTSGPNTPGPSSPALGVEEAKQ